MSLFYYFFGIYIFMHVFIYSICIAQISNQGPWVVNNRKGH